MALWFLFSSHFDFPFHSVSSLNLCRIGRNTLKSPSLNTEPSVPPLMKGSLSSLWPPQEKGIDGLHSPVRAPVWHLAMNKVCFNVFNYSLNKVKPTLRLDFGGDSCGLHMFSWIFGTCNWKDITLRPQMSHILWYQRCPLSATSVTLCGFLVRSVLATQTRVGSIPLPPPCQAASVSGRVCQHCELLHQQYWSCGAKLKANLHLFKNNFPLSCLP